MTNDEVTPSTAPVTPRADGRLYAADVAAAKGVTEDEYLSPLRDTAAAYASDPSLCDWCEAELPEPVDRRGQAGRYCPGPTCRKAASRHRGEQAARDQGGQP